MSTPEKVPPIPPGIPLHVVMVAEHVRLMGQRDRREMREGREQALADLAAERKAA